LPSVSGEPPTTPVVSKKSGLVFEARLIRKYIQENGKDPISGEELTEEDIIEVKASEWIDAGHAAWEDHHDEKYANKKSTRSC
jgi:hypothetical protein